MACTLTCVNWGHAISLTWRISTGESAKDENGRLNNEADEDPRVLHSPALPGLLVSVGHLIGTTARHRCHQMLIFRSCDVQLMINQIIGC